MRKDLGDDHSLSGLFLDLHSEPAVAAGGGRVELRELLGGEELGIRILQLADESAGRLLVEHRGIDRVDIAALDQVEDLSEEATAVECGALLHDKRPSYEGKEHGADQGKLFHENTGRREDKKTRRPSPLSTSGAGRWVPAGSIIVDGSYTYASPVRDARETCCPDTLC